MVNWVVFWIIAFACYLGIFFGFWILDQYLEQGKNNNKKTD